MQFKVLLVSAESRSDTMTLFYVVGGGSFFISHWDDELAKTEYWEIVVAKDLTGDYFSPISKVCLVFVFVFSYYLFIFWLFMILLTM